jgi:putative Ca2+/H+ antiporter (TMEM165/GDT1 family)
MLSENSTAKTQASTFSLFAFFRNFAIFAGTLIGGLAKPAEQFPKVFKGVWFFERFPFALPTIITGVVVLICLLLAVFVIEEV